MIFYAYYNASFAKILISYPHYMCVKIGILCVYLYICGCMLQMSGSRMKVAGRFKPCAHMGCFDLEVFVEMNQRSRKASSFEQL